MPPRAVDQLQPRQAAEALFEAAASRTRRTHDDRRRRGRRRIDQPALGRRGREMKEVGQPGRVESRGLAEGDGRRDVRGGDDEASLVERRTDLPAQAKARSAA